LTAKQLADFLGISRKKIYELFHTPSVYGGIPNFKVGATNKVDKDDLKNWIMNKKKEKVRE
jgi:excisionase family DNA binding protein